MPARTAPLDMQIYLPDGWITDRERLTYVWRDEHGRDLSRRARTARSVTTQFRDTVMAASNFWLSKSGTPNLHV